MQSSCKASSFHAFSLPALGLQRCPQLREMAVAFDPPQARLDEAQRTGYPALFLVRRAPGSRKRGQATFQESRVDSNGLKLFFDRS